MKIGIIGTGGIGQALAGHIAKAGFETIVSNSRGPESLAALVTIHVWRRCSRQGASGQRSQQDRFRHN